jgi:hypothetical protein
MHDSAGDTAKQRLRSIDGRSNISCNLKDSDFARWFAKRQVIGAGLLGQAWACPGRSSIGSPER